MKQSIFTFIAKVDPARLSELEVYLAQVRKNVPRDPDLPFASLPMLHFASFVIFYDDAFGPYLVFENNVDGTPRAYLEALLDVASPALHRIYGMCLEYDGGDADDRARLGAFLLARLTLPHTAFIGAVGRSAQRIKDDTPRRGRVLFRPRPQGASLAGDPGVTRRRVAPEQPPQRPLNVTVSRSIATPCRSASARIVRAGTAKSRSAIDPQAVQRKCACGRAAGSYTAAASPGTSIFITAPASCNRIKARWTVANPIRGCSVRARTHSCCEVRWLPGPASSTTARTVR